MTGSLLIILWHEPDYEANNQQHCLLHVIYRSLISLSSVLKLELNTITGGNGRERLTTLIVTRLFTLVEDDSQKHVRGRRWRNKSHLVAAVYTLCTGEEGNGGSPVSPVQADSQSASSETQGLFKIMCRSLCRGSQWLPRDKQHKRTRNLTHTFLARLMAQGLDGGELK